MLNLEVRPDSFGLRNPFTISRSTITSVDIVTVEISRGAERGRGECRPYSRYGETVECVVDQIEACRFDIEKGLGCRSLQDKLPAGAARNAVDCALWDLEAKTSGTPVWKMAGLTKPKPRQVTYTISLGEPAAMADAARSSGRNFLKLKLGAEGDLERLQRIRQAVPAARLIVDANEGWTVEFLARNMPHLAELGIELIEQPLPASQDDELKGFSSLVPLCADESCHDTSSLSRLPPAFAYINIKLDKTGGLSGALELISAAKATERRIMLGCMMASSLAMAPAFLLADCADYVDLDAPLLLAEDREHAFEFEGEMMLPPSPLLWG